MVIWPYAVIKIDFWRQLGLAQVKWGQILESTFLHKLHISLAQNFLRIPNMPLFFFYDV